MILVLFSTWKRCPVTFLTCGMAWIILEDVVNNLPLKKVKTSVGRRIVSWCLSVISWPSFKEKGILALMLISANITATPALTIYLSINLEHGGWWGQGGWGAHCWSPKQSLWPPTCTRPFHCPPRRKVSCHRKVSSFVYSCYIFLSELSGLLNEDILGPRWVEGRYERSFIFVYLCFIAFYITALQDGPEGGGQEGRR